MKDNNLPKVIALISQKGGVGKSTFARALAVEATKKKFFYIALSYTSQT